MIKVEDMMTRHPHTLSATDTIRKASLLMRKHDIHHLPIIDEADQLLGVVSQRDILSAQESSLSQPISQDDTMSNPLMTIMHKDVMTVSPKAGLKESALYMQKHSVGCLPVVDHTRLVGIITDSDFVTIAINLLEIQEEVEPDEITDDGDNDF
ncbi:CBS domain-containing protein [Vibrio sp.]|uniref:CBS domain-containing protein n=1 Tax=Vibrio viridaestus TaxID=2487322 RepID=A0A3N9TEY4_9VIBR|nr:CBS domain-containing protein [Vibrio viridaestus]MDC0609107.1 CBS domain-containing protein [Vibrio sp.]RQW62283.1 CBS domain-containing protein [Vibrio viridaestus]